jgi:hypothetical protein
MGITLIEIPYWWDFEADSLIATIHSYRPDIFPEPGTGTPIPVTCPPNFSRLQNSKYAIRQQLLDNKAKG